MKNTMHRLMMGGLLLLLVLTLASSPRPYRNADAQTTEPGSGKVEVDVPVRGTFLRTLDWWPYLSPGVYEYDEDLDMYLETSGLYHPEKPAIVDLDAKGFAENDKVQISYTEAVYDAGAWSDHCNLWVNERVIALFSATTDLKPIGEMHRVPGAIDFGEDTTTDGTHWNQSKSDLADKLATKGIILDRGGETDIPEDFLITPYSGMNLRIPKGAKYLFLCLNDSYYPDNTGSLKVTIQKVGGVEDGYGHELGGVEVTLLAPSSGGSTTIAVTLTDDEGGYAFSGIDEGDYKIEVALEYHKEVGDTATFSVNYDTGSSVRAQTNTFHVTGGTVARDISFADADLIPAAGIPQDRLDDLAAMYYHVKQVVDFELDELGVTPDLLLPIEVRAYRQGTTEVFYSGGDISIGDAASGYNDADRPMNRDWHEMFHELMDDTMEIPPRHTGDTNHDGFKNHCTGDSWVEGWAEFWSCGLKRSLDDPGWRVYDWAGGNTNLEYIWRVWDDEEFAVASLLVDLADPVDPADGDYISLTNGQLWAIIGSQSLTDMNGVYSALVAANIGQLDIDTDNITDLDELFIAHGFFADDGNQQYDGETVGLGGKPGRTDKPAIPGASILILVEDSQGNPVNTGTLMVDVTFPSPMDIYNYSYEVSLSGSDSQVGFYVAPDGDDALMTMRVRDGSGATSDVLMVPNSVYWERVNKSTTAYAAEHTFVIGSEGETTVAGATGTASGGVPVWMWPVAAVAVVAAGAGGFLLLRGRAKQG
jgi:hypothetical protein